MINDKCQIPNNFSIAILTIYTLLYVCPIYYMLKKRNKRINKDFVKNYGHYHYDDDNQKNKTVVWYAMTENS